MFTINFVIITIIIMSNVIIATIHITFEIDIYGASGIFAKIVMVYLSLLLMRINIIKNYNDNKCHHNQHCRH